MKKKVDSGNIIDLKKFKISKNETVKSLSLKTYKQMFIQFKKISGLLLIFNLLTKIL